MSLSFVDEPVVRGFGSAVWIALLGMLSPPRQMESAIENVRRRYGAKHSFTPKRWSKLKRTIMPARRPEPEADDYSDIDWDEPGTG